MWLATEKQKKQNHQTVASDVNARRKHDDRACCNNNGNNSCIHIHAHFIFICVISFSDSWLSLSASMQTSRKPYFVCVCVCACRRFRTGTVAVSFGWHFQRSQYNTIRMQKSYSLVFCQSTTLSLLYNNIKLRFKRILCIALVPVSVIWNIRFFLVLAQLLLFHYMHACSFIIVGNCTLYTHDSSPKCISVAA